MTLPFELFVALRYLLARRKQAFISLISLISAVGVAVGVMALIIALALMTGLQRELRDRILGSAAHVYVWKLGQGFPDYEAEARQLRQQPAVVGAAPAVLGKAIISSSRSEGFVTVKGIDPTLEASVTNLPAALEAGSLEALTPDEDDPLSGILIGRDLSTALGASVGDTVTLLTPQGTLTPSGMTPRVRRFHVVGIFSLGLYEFDAAYAFVALPVALRLFDREYPEFLQLRVSDIYQAPAIADRLAETLGPEYVTQDWSDLNRSLFSALWLEKMAISITIGLIVMVAALNIVASLVLLVMEKNRDIAILKTMGAGGRSIRWIFMLQGLIIGLVGTTAGAAAGYVVSTVADRYQLIRLPIDVYQIAHVPFVIEPWDFLIVVASAVVTCFVATVYPSRQAARLDPAQALRYE